MVGPTLKPTHFGGVDPRSFGGDRAVDFRANYSELLGLIVYARLVTQ